MRRPIRLAILEADTPVPAVLTQHGSYGSIFTALFERACASLDPPEPLSSLLDISVHHVVYASSAPSPAVSSTTTAAAAAADASVDEVPMYPDPESLDAILITGSKHDAFSSEPWIERLVAFTKRCLEIGPGSGRGDAGDGDGEIGGGSGVKIIGVCFGHQILGRAMGAQVARAPKGWEISVTEVELTEEGRRVFGEEMRGKLRIQQMHRDAVASYPPGTTSLARNAICEIQAMYTPRRVISVQGHPEFTGDMVREILKVRHENGIIGDDLFADGVARAQWEQDGTAIARAFLRFLREYI